MKIVIIGGGWAGLSAAVRLCRQHEVTVLEAAPEIGGRARAVTINAMQLDNGQHALLGAYHHLWQLLEEMGVSPKTVTKRYPLKWYMAGKTGAITSKIEMKPLLPAPFFLLNSLLLASGLSLHDKWSAINFGRSVIQKSFTLPQDCSVSELLAQHNQSPLLVNQIWTPLCFAALTTPPEKASAQIFLTTMELGFNQKASDCDILLPRNTLSDVLPIPAQEYITKHNGHVFTLTRAEELIFTEEKLTGVRSKEKLFAADKIIIATPPEQALSLISPYPALSELQKTLQRFRPSPITTIYLQYDRPIMFEYPMIGLHDTITHWLFTKAHCQHPTVVAGVISGPGEHETLDNATLIARVNQEALATLCPKATLLQGRVVREKYGGFECAVGNNQWRPDNQTTIENLWLAGDYTNTKLPATLEGAVQSGVNCANRIMSFTKLT